MLRKYDFIVYGEAVGKGRPRFRKVGNFVQTYNTTETINYENLVKLAFVEKYPDFKTIEKDIPISCSIDIYKQIPKSVSKKRQLKMENGIILPTTKPDIDNVVKSIFDGLNKITFHDDSQIVALTVTKSFSKTPRVEITIKELNEEYE